MSEVDSYIKNQCMRERRFQDSKLRDLAVAHEILTDAELNDEEKVASLIIRGWGKQRAKELVYGEVRV